MTKKYFQDHLILLLLSINSFLSIGSIIFVLLKLSTNHYTSYFVQYRPKLGTSAYQTGSVTQLISFAVFAAIILGINASLSFRLYKIHRQLAITVLALGILLLLLSLIISNALLLLR